MLLYLSKYSREIIILVLLAFIYWFIYHQGYDKCESAVLKAQQEATIKANNNAVRSSAELALQLEQQKKDNDALTATYTDIKAKLDAKQKTSPVIIDCPISHEWVQYLNTIN